MSRHPSTLSHIVASATSPSTDVAHRAIGPKRVDRSYAKPASRWNFTDPAEVQKSPRTVEPRAAGKYLTSMDLPLAWPEYSRPRSQLRYMVSGPQQSNLQQLSKTAFPSGPTGAGL